MNDEAGESEEPVEGASGADAQRDQALANFQPVARRIQVAAAYEAFGETWRWTFWQADDEGPEALRSAVMDFLRVEAQWLLEDRGEKFEAWPPELDLCLYAVDSGTGEMELWVAGEAPDCLAVLDGEGGKDEREWVLGQLFEEE